MPKIRRARSLSLEKSRTSPYQVSQNHADSLESAQNVKEWEEARCPICMEHPHNAVLLKCSSHDRGCRPYMCKTSYRHSNCFDQFCKLYGQIPLITELQDIPSTHVVSHRQMVECPPAGQYGHGRNQLASEFVCPLCRGSIYGYIVVEPARLFMNSKVRSCSSENCDFSGTYSELRKHARSEHPNVRPSEVDPMRHRDWIRWQRERDFEDIVSLVQSNYAVDSDGESFTRAIRFWTSSFVTEMNDSPMDLLSDSMLDALRDFESLQNRMENVQRDLNSNNFTSVGNNSLLETRPYSQYARRRDFASFHRHATQLHGQNQRQRVVESMYQSPRLRWRSQTSFDRHQRSFEGTSRTPEPRRQYGSMYKSSPRASRLRWRNQRWLSSSLPSRNERYVKTMRSHVTCSSKQV